MLQKWILSSLWILFMILGITFIKKENIREVFIEIFGEEHRFVIEHSILFDSIPSLIIASFVPFFNIFYLIMYLVYGFCDKDSEIIQKLKKEH